MLHSYTTLFHGNRADDLTANSQELPLRASVGLVLLVLVVLGPPSTHRRYHDAVHVEPSLTQRRRVGLAQTALQHEEKGLPQHLKESNTPLDKYPSLSNSYVEVLLQKCLSYSERLRADSHCLMLFPEIDQEFLQRVKIIQVGDGCINHKHHLQ